MFSWLFGSLKKSNRLKELSTQLSQPVNYSDVFRDYAKHTAQMASKDLLVDEMLDFCMSDVSVQQVMNNHEIDKGVLKDYYSMLSLQGAGQWAGGHYVSISSLAYGKTLEYMISNQNDWPRVAYRSIKYFEKGETGIVRG